MDFMKMTVTDIIDWCKANGEVAWLKKTAATEIDGRKITFDVEAYDNAGLIGKGTHERFSIKAEKFMLKAEERKSISAE